MEAISALVESIATIMWPLIVIIIIVLFRESVKELIDSARKRKFSVKIGDMEIEMDELSKQQGVMIKDLQARVNKIQRKMEIEEGKVKAISAQPESVLFRDAKMPAEILEAKAQIELDEDIPELDDDIHSILWVDDEPENNAFLIDALRKYYNLAVFKAQDTKEAMERFSGGKFDCIISDTCRHEGGTHENCKAGFELARQIRQTDSKVPVYIYTDKKVDKILKSQAKKVGATAITSSPSELLKLLSD